MIRRALFWLEGLTMCEACVARIQNRAASRGFPTPYAKPLGVSGHCFECEGR